MSLPSVIVCLLSMVTLVKSQNGSYTFNNIVAVHFTNNSRPNYFDDGFVAGEDELLYSMLAVSNRTVTQGIQLQVFRQTGMDIGSRKLCVSSPSKQCVSSPSKQYVSSPSKQCVSSPSKQYVSSPSKHQSNCSGGACSWRRLAVRNNYELSLKVKVTLDLNNSGLVMQLREVEGSWFVFTPVIRVHAMPVFTVRFNDSDYNINSCTYQVAIGQAFTVEFCSEFLKSPSLEVSLHGSPRDPVNGRCAVQNFSVLTERSLLQLIYRDGCKRVGSFTCVIISEYVDPFTN
ncbi:hypothetical protein Btru_071720 [Bulinus truncatus]|nr:hypothetical protein Btru_071720 [Bulinus truncatus]